MTASIAIPRLLVGAASSGSGKTTLTLGLLRALTRRGRRVAPFKCGPDYIDPHYHRLAAGRESINLDRFLASDDHLRSLFGRYAAEADIAVAEGVMGLWDGYDADEGSSASVARLLEMPVILIADARSTAYSVAPLLYGFRTYGRRNGPDGGPRIAGVIFNRVASGNHYAQLRRAALDAGVEPLGYLPRDGRFAVPSRHLGLSLDHLEEFSPVVDAVADAIEAHVDLDRLEALAAACPEVAFAETARESETKGWRIAVARDEAFNFIYRANLDRLGELGHVTCFSPVRGDTLPDCDLLYLPGGYPECFARELEAAGRLRRDIAAYAEAGGRIVAECGGMIYLTQGLRTESGERRAMCGVLPLEASMQPMRLRLGYREVHLDGKVIRGHEFHYSHTEGALPSAARQFDARGREVATPLYRYKNVLAGYTHLYWGAANPLDWF